MAALPRSFGSNIVPNPPRRLTANQRWHGANRSTDCAQMYIDVAAQASTRPQFLAPSPRRPVRVWSELHSLGSYRHACYAQEMLDPVWPAACAAPRPFSNRGRKALVSGISTGFLHKSLRSRLLMMERPHDRPQVISLAS